MDTAPGWDRPIHALQSKAIRTQQGGGGQRQANGKGNGTEGINERGGMTQETRSAMNRSIEEPAK